MTRSCHLLNDSLCLAVVGNLKNAKQLTESFGTALGGDHATSSTTHATSEPAEDYEAQRETPPPLTIHIAPRAVHGVAHLVGAVVRALSRWRAGKMKTRALQTELLWCLSPSSQISEALNKVPIRSFDTEAIVMTLFATSDEFTEICGKVDGTIRLRCDGFEKTLLNASLSHGNTAGNEDGNQEAVAKVAVLDEMCKAHLEEFRAMLKVSDIEAQLPGGLEAAVLMRVAIKEV